MAGRLPHALVLVLDQAEEVFTLAKTPEEVAGRDHALRMLQRLVDVKADVKLIVSLRTGTTADWSNRLAMACTTWGVPRVPPERFRRRVAGGGRAPPASTVPIPYAAEIPFEKYGFRYDDGVAKEIARRVIAHTTRRNDSDLPLLQVICTQASTKTSASEPTTWSTTRISTRSAAWRGDSGGM